MVKYVQFLIFSLIVFSCSSIKHTDISYKSAEEKESPKLNIFVPKSIEPHATAPVLFFVHGGNWNSGKKGLYSQIGRYFAKKGIVTVIPNYSKSPDVSYKEMTQEIATAIKWTKEHIDEYKGDTNHLFLSGHSAGGHLSTLAILDPAYDIDSKNISGIILIDAAGLDMYSYLKKNPPTKKNDYISTWTSSPEEWRKASPLYYLDTKAPRFMVYVGDKTYPSIKTSNKKFITKLKELGRDPKVIYVNKKHIPMITQFFKSGSKRYDEIIKFINESDPVL